MKMATPQPQLFQTFVCPLKTTDFTPSSQGNFCSQCSKHIPDLRKTPEENIIHQIELTTGKEDYFCGTFSTHQLKDPFKNPVKNKIVTWYQGIKQKHTSSNRFVVFIAFIILVASGCKRVTSGMVAYSYGNRPTGSIHHRHFLPSVDQAVAKKKTIIK